jgi:N-acetylmuramic acid 6-phosphate etherase
VTFSTDENQFITVVAGGDRAILKAQEGAEDSEHDGSTRLVALRVTSKDTVIGISASGRTPFVIGALKVALDAGALTATITNTSPSVMGTLGAKHRITVLVGPEFIAGSTRLKAGSAAKQILNMISTCSMVKLGKT